jgi:L-cysteine S-thiosulfotransferase
MQKKYLNSNSYKIIAPPALLRGGGMAGRASAATLSPSGYAWRLKLRALAACAVFLLAVGGACAQQRPIARDALKSGIEFAGPDVRSMQGDDFANPGMLWVTRGEKLWRAPDGAQGRSCASCHQDGRDSMKGVAARYPRIDPGSARLVNVEGRINLCRARHQEAPPLEYESEALLSLAAYVAHQSRGMPADVNVDTQNRRNFERGRDFYYRRMGQMNLSCAHCHDMNWGRRLLAETISQGHGNAYPAYRLEWQSVGSLHRRLRSCLSGVRAETLPAGGAELLDLELFLAWRGQGLPIETPGVRR